MLSSKIFSTNELLSMLKPKELAKVQAKYEDTHDDTPIVKYYDS